MSERKKDRQKKERHSLLPPTLLGVVLSEFKDFDRKHPACIDKKENISIRREFGLLVL